MTRSYPRGARLAGSSDTVVNPGFKYECDRCQSLPALQREVAGADQMARYTVVNPNRQAPEAHTPPPPVCLHPLRSRWLDTRYIGWIAITQRVAVGRCGSLV